MSHRIEPDLPDLDLDLLRVLDAVYTERNVSRAAQRLGVSQPVVSHALTRLRLLLKDQLFSREPGGVKPTVLTTLIAPTIHRAISDIRVALQQTLTFVPQSSDRVFGICVSDSGELAFLPTLQRAISGVAPDVRVRSVRVPLAELGNQLEAQAVHVAVGHLPDMGAEFERVFLYDENYVLVMGEHHPLADEPMTREVLLRLEFVVVGRYRDVEHLMAEQGIADQIRLRVGHYLPLPLLLAGSDLVAFLPRSLVAPLGLFGRYRTFAIPAIQRRFSLSAIRHQRAGKDPGAQWFWEQVTKSIAQAHT